MKKFFLTESQLQLIKLNEKIGRYLERLIQHSFETLPEYASFKQNISNNLTKNGLNLPFTITTFGEWNIAIDIPINVIKSYSENLENKYSEKFKQAQRYGGFGYNRANDLGFKGLENLYGDAYEKGGYKPKEINPYSNYYNVIIKNKGVKYDKNIGEFGGYYSKIMPKKENMFTDFRNEVLNLKSIIEKSGYEIVNISNVYANSSTIIKGKKQYCEQKCVRFHITNKEIESWQENILFDPEYQEYRAKDKNGLLN